MIGGLSPRYPINPAWEQWSNRTILGRPTTYQGPWKGVESPRSEASSDGESSECEGPSVFERLRDCYEMVVESIKNFAAVAAGRPSGRHLRGHFEDRNRLAAQLTLPMRSLDAGDFSGACRVFFNPTSSHEARTSSLSDIDASALRRVRSSLEAALAHPRCGRSERDVAFSFLESVLGPQSSAAECRRKLKRYWLVMHPDKPDGALKRDYGSQYRNIVRDELLETMHCCKKILDRFDAH